ERDVGMKGREREREMKSRESRCRLVPTENSSTDTRHLSLLQRLKFSLETGVSASFQSVPELLLISLNGLAWVEAAGSVAVCVGFWETRWWCWCWWWWWWWWRWWGEGRSGE